MDRQMTRTMEDLTEKVEAMRVASATRFDILEGQLSDLNGILAEIAKERRKDVPGWAFYAFMVFITVLAIGGLIH